MAGLIVFGLLVILFIALVAGIVWLLLKGLHKAEQYDRRKFIERDMRQQIIDRETEKKVAQKILHEAGESK